MPFLIIGFFVLDEPNTKNELKFVITLGVFHLLGIFSVVSLGGSHLKNSDKEIVISTCKSHFFLKVKLISVYVFGACYLLYCGLNIWECVFQIEVLGIANYVVTSVQVLIILIYFALFYKRQYKYKCYQKIITIFAISLIYICTSADALSSVFPLKLHTNSTLPPQNIARAIKALDKTEPLVPSAIIEFSLLTIALIFQQASETNGEADLQSIDSNSTDSVNLNYKVEFGCEFTKTMIQYIFFLASCSIFAFTFAELLSESTADLNAYILMHLIINSTTLVLVIIIFIFFIRLIRQKCENSDDNCKCSCSNSSFSPWLIILIVTFVCHIIHLIVCCHCKELREHVNISQHVLADNIINVIIAIIQLLFVLGTYFFRKCAVSDTGSKLVRKFVYFSCSLIGMINMGQWISYSIGKEKLMYKPDIDNFWKLFKTFTFFLSIFFRFQTGLEFLKLYWCSIKPKT